MTGPRGLIVAISASLITGCAIGLITGVLFARAVMFPHPFERRPHGGPPGPRAIRFVEQRLGLSAEQSARFRAILDRARSRADSLHEEARVQILAILTPEQRDRWEQMNHRMFPGHGARGEPFRGHRGGPGGPDGPPGGPDDEPGGPPPPDSAP